MIAVTGASGPLGKTTVESLLHHVQPETVVALVRDPAKVADLAEKGVQVRQADYDGYVSLVQALAGVEKLLFVSSSVVGEARVRQHTNVIAAAKAAGVKHVFYTSVPNPSLTSPFTPAADHFLTEQGLKESGLTYTFFRNNLYLEVLPMLLGDAAQSGTLYFPGGEGKISPASRSEMAEGFAQALSTGGHENKTYDIGTPTAWSLADLAGALAQATGASVAYVDVPVEGYQKALAQHLPPELAGMLAGMAAALKENQFNTPDPTLETLLGRKPIEPAEFLKNTLVNV